MAYEGEYETVEDYDEEDSGEEEEDVEEVVVTKRRTKKWKVCVFSLNCSMHGVC